MHRKIHWQVAALCLIQAILIITAVAGAILMRMDWALAACIGLLGMIALRDCIRGLDGRGIWVAAGLTVLMWGFWLANLDGIYDAKPYEIGFACAVIATFFISGKRMERARGRQQWNALALVWALGASAVALVKTYVYPDFHSFHWAVAAMVLTLIASRNLLNLPSFGIQVVHTAILLLIGLPLADAIRRPSGTLEAKPEMVKDYYSFAAAQEDPASFALWWGYFVDEWNHLHKSISMPDKEGVARYRMKPNSRAKIFDSEIVINSLGFRGPEIEREKGDAYRIVAIGESTTFGCTITEEGKPWPRVLEGMLREEIKTDRTIEVINAGVYGVTLEENVRRLKQRILSLKPDMIISYHGYNFFSSLNTAIPLASGKAPPAYVVRPLRLLADFEHRIKLRIYKWKRFAPLNLKKPSIDPMRTRYAAAYRELINVCKKNGVRLVLANFSMAVNAESAPEVIEFYRSGFPTVLADIRANRAHAEIVAEVTGNHPEIIYVNTHPVLDGQHEKFIDLVHFTQNGRRDMARAFLTNIRSAIKREVSRFAVATNRPGRATMQVVEGKTALKMKVGEREEQGM